MAPVDTDTDPVATGDRGLVDVGTHCVDTPVAVEVRIVQEYGLIKWINFEKTKICLRGNGFRKRGEERSSMLEAIVLRRMREELVHPSEVLKGVLNSANG
jgi:hypothetical protein